MYNSKWANHHNLIHQTFGDFKVTKYLGAMQDSGGVVRSFWNCKCVHCNKEFSIKAIYLKRNKNNCSCKNKYKRKVKL